jgi:hypothetical protein
MTGYTTPWIDSKYVDKAVVCAVCGQWVSAGEPRKYSPRGKVSAHPGCIGAWEMKDHTALPPGTAPDPPAQGEASKTESREAAIERMHKEKMDAFSAINESVRSLKASVVELNMLMSVAVERYVKEAPK